MYSEQVESLLRQGAQSLGEKKYEEAVEAFGKACGVYQEEKGDMDPNLFLLYGKALYESGVSKSDVLGGQEITNEKIEESAGAVEDEKHQFNHLAVDEEEEEASEEEEAPEEEDDDEEAPEQDQDQEEADEDEDKTDLELAWDILEISRGLFEKKLEDAENKDLEVPYLKSDKEEPKDDYVKALKLLSEVYDLLGEVSLESEHFTQAANDLEECLNMRLKLYDADYSALVGESHFKLSLALEFCLEDESAKQKARDHIQSAIKILKNDSTRNPDKKSDNDDIIQSLQERYNEIETSAEDTINQQKQVLMEGLLGKPGSSDLVNQLSKPVNDLSGMVKKRKAKPSDGSKRQKK